MEGLGDLVKEHLILGTDKQDAEKQRDLWLSQNPALKGCQDASSETGAADLADAYRQQACSARFDNGGVRGARHPRGNAFTAGASIGREPLREISRWRRFSKPGCESVRGEREANDARQRRSPPRRRRSRVATRSNI